MPCNRKGCVTIAKHSQTTSCADKQSKAATGVITHPTKSGGLPDVHDTTSIVDTPYLACAEKATLDYIVVVLLGVTIFNQLLTGSLLCATLCYGTAEGAALLCASCYAVHHVCLSILFPSR